MRRQGETWGRRIVRWAIALALGAILVSVVAGVAHGWNRVAPWWEEVNAAPPTVVAPPGASIPGPSEVDSHYLTVRSYFTRTVRRIDGHDVYQYSPDVEPYIHSYYLRGWILVTVVRTGEPGQSTDSLLWIFSRH